MLLTSIKNFGDNVRKGANGWKSSELVLAKALDCEPEVSYIGNRGHALPSLRIHGSVESPPHHRKTGGCLHSGPHPQGGSRDDHKDW
jgi:hypothetical protein